MAVPEKRMPSLKTKLRLGKTLCFSSDIQTDKYEDFR